MEGRKRAQHVRRFLGQSQGDQIGAQRAGRAKQEPPHVGDHDRRGGPGEENTALITPARFLIPRNQSPAATPKTNANPTEATVQTTVWKNVCQNSGSLSNVVKFDNPMYLDELAPSVASVRLNLNPSRIGM